MVDLSGFAEFSEFFKAMGIGASLIPFAIAAGPTAPWAPSPKRQSRAVQVLKIVLRLPTSRSCDRSTPAPPAARRKRRGDRSRSAGATTTSPRPAARRETPRMSWTAAVQDMGVP